MPPTYDRQGKRKPTEPPEELDQLTEKQEKFILALLEGNRPIEAYDKAYGKNNAKESTRYKQASKLKANPKIRSVLRYYQREGMDNALISKENHLSELARGREIAYALGQASAGIQAEHYRGRVAGLYETKVDLRIGPSDDALLDQIAELLGDEVAGVIGQGLAPEPIDITPPSPEQATVARRDPYSDD